MEHPDEDKMQKPVFRGYIEKMKKKHERNEKKRMKE